MHNGCRRRKIIAYISPFLFASSEFIAARQSDDYTFCILTCPVGPYYRGTVKVKIEQEYTVLPAVVLDLQRLQKLRWFVLSYCTSGKRGI